MKVGSKLDAFAVLDVGGGGRFDSSSHSDTRTKHVPFRSTASATEYTPTVADVLWDNLRRFLLVFTIKLSVQNFLCAPVAAEACLFQARSVTAAPSSFGSQDKVTGCIEESAGGSISCSYRIPLQLKLWSRDSLFLSELLDTLARSSAFPGTQTSGSVSSSTPAFLE